MELYQPYFFTRDDALVGELPMVLTACRSLAAGVFPDYDPWILLGAPLAATGLPSITYPPTMLAWALARALGDENATFEVFAFLHLFAGYVLTWRALRQLGTGADLAMLLALWLPFSGPILVMGRCWHMIVPLAAWAPALGLLAIRLLRPVGPAWAFTVGVAIATAWQVGFTQISIWTVLFAATLGVVLVGLGHVPLRRLAWTVPAGLVAAAGAAPLLVAQLFATAEVRNAGGYGNGVAAGLLAMIVPVSAPHPNGWGTPAGMGALYSWGGFPALATLLALASWRPRHGTRPWFAFAVVAGILLLAALGDDGPIWPVLRWIPIFGKINNHPFRLLPFVATASIFAAGPWLEALVRGRMRTVVVALGLLLLLGHLRRPGAFYDYGFLPYPAPSSVLENVPAESRFLSLAPARSHRPDYGEGLPHNLPLLTRRSTIDGYDPIAELSTPFRAAHARIHRAPIEALARYGVSHVLAPPDLGGDWDPAFLGRWDTLTAALIAGSTEVERDGWSLRALPSPDPLAFSDRPLPITLDASGATVKLGGEGAPTVNLLAIPGLVAEVDGHEVPIAADEWGRVTVDARGDVLRVRYHAPWATGLGVGAVLLTAGLGAAWGMRRRGW